MGEKKSQGVFSVNVYETITDLQNDQKMLYSGGEDEGEIEGNSIGSVLLWGAFESPLVVCRTIYEDTLLL